MVVRQDRPSSGARRQQASSRCTRNAPLIRAAGLPRRSSKSPTQLPPGNTQYGPSRRECCVGLHARWPYGLLIVGEWAGACKPALRFGTFPNSRYTRGCATASDNGCDRCAASTSFSGRVIRTHAAPAVALRRIAPGGCSGLRSCPASQEKVAMGTQGQPASSPAPFAPKPVMPRHDRSCRYPPCSRRRASPSSP